MYLWIFPVLKPTCRDKKINLNELLTINNNRLKVVCVDHMMLGNFTSRVYGEGCDVLPCKVPLSQMAAEVLLLHCCPYQSQVDAYGCGKKMKKSSRSKPLPLNAVKIVAITFPASSQLMA